ncbi:MAG TPA: HAD family phosphatase [Terriglobia bacterium]|jgi:beta-phosphoglucomutase|nr:HAD family phosphatase [Terriglobia bacterium]
MKSNSRLPSALIFDMDGVLVDSNPFHVQKWIEFLHERGIPYNAEDLPKQVLGSRNDTAFRRFFGRDLREGEIEKLSEDLEARFRAAFRPHAQPLLGLKTLMDECRAEGIPLAVASSAMTKNVDFVVDTLKLRSYFASIVTGDDVSRPKPDPEIYIQAAERLTLAPAKCVAFEDSFVGIESAKRASMKCVAIASTFPAEELQSQTQADLVVKNFEELSLARLRELFKE